MTFLESIGLDSLDLTIAIVMALFTLWFSWFQFMRAQRQRTSDLYSEFYNSDHYRRVVMPVYRLTRRVEALPDGAKEEYWRAIVAGWDRTPDSAALYEAFVTRQEREMSAMEQHFYVESSTEMHTEHEALTAFLYFWVRAHRMLNTGLVNKALFVELFCNSFAYYHGFIEELRVRVEDVFACEPERVQRQKPGWITATRYIEDLLEPRT